jgi:hypothetical protein
MNECLVRSIGACILGLLRADDTALLKPTADAGVTVMATEELIIGVVTLCATGAVGGTVVVTREGDLPIASCVEGGEVRFISPAATSTMKDS